MHLVYGVRMKEIRKILKDKGLRATPARMAVIDMLSKTRLPIDARVICKKFSRIRKLKKINEATVYRTLASLEEGGVIKRIDLRKDSAHFELSAGRHHHHIVCVRCSEIEDFENVEVEKALGRVAGRSVKFKSVHEHSLELFGLCKACA